MSKELRFSTELFAFLRELKSNNDRAWFEANKLRYQEVIRDPFLAFIAAFNPRLQSISPFFIADPKPTGGSFFRIYRDTRFSKNKAPYKTNASAYFPHQAGKVNAPGIYLHFEPDNCFAGMGIYQPDPQTRTKITDAIVSRADEWQAVASNKALRKHFKFGGESLQRVPKQYDPNHPLAEDLRRKDFIVIAPLSEQQVCAKDLLDRFETLCATAAPLLQFLTHAINLPWSAQD